MYTILFHYTILCIVYSIEYSHQYYNQTKIYCDYSILSSNSDCIYIIGHPLHFRQNIGKFNRNIQIKRDFERGNFKFYKRGNKLSMDLVFVYFNQSMNAMVVHQ